MSRWPILREVVREACYGLYHHRFRAALSMLGISWGIISVVVLLAYGDGFRGALDAGFRGAFSDGTVVVWPGQTSLQAGGERAGKRVRVTSDDVMALAVALCALVNTLPLPARFAGMIISWQIATLSLFMLVAVGVVTSTYPARRAAELPPVESLRFEM